jgi:hypothetical protein
MPTNDELPTVQPVTDPSTEVATEELTEVIAKVVVTNELVTEVPTEPVAKTSGSPISPDLIASVLAQMSGGQFQRAMSQAPVVKKAQLSEAEKQANRKAEAKAKKARKTAQRSQRINRK